MNILALATHPVEGASTRFRVLGYLPFLERHGHRVTFHPFFPSEAYATIYRSGSLLRKLYYVLRGALGRAIQLNSGSFDLLFIHREIFPLGWTVFLSVLKKRRFRIVYDYDDALFLPQRQHRWLLGRLENPNGTQRLISASDATVAGNRYLLEYAKRYNPRVVIIPTAIDTSALPTRTNGQHHGKCVIGWIGSHTTEKYIHSLRPVFEMLSTACSFTVKIVGATRRFSVDRAEVVFLPWQLEREMEEFQSCDIGVYPLWDDEWARGKCGFKVIQFMAAGIPVVASAIGTNREIIQDGVNGFLATSEEEWCDKIRCLVDDPVLRQKIGMAGRETVEKHYSLAVNAPKLLEVLNTTLPGQTTRMR
jgi:glycosyltransferase involved in cell wall biosynthesis